MCTFRSLTVFAARTQSRVSRALSAASNGDDDDESLSAVGSLAVADVLVVTISHPSREQVLEAADGAQAAGWPAFHKSKVHASPLLYDVDSDGVQDVLIATYDGQILAFRDTVRWPICAGALLPVCDSASTVHCTYPRF